MLLQYRRPSTKQKKILLFLTMYSLTSQLCYFPKNIKENDTLAQQMNILHPESIKSI